MPRFRYRALRPTGAEIAGELVAADEGDAVTQLQAIGSYPIELSAPATRRNRQEATLLSWLRALPEEVIRRRPVLSNAYAAALLAIWRPQFHV